MKLLLIATIAIGSTGLPLTAPTKPQPNASPLTTRTLEVKVDFHRKNGVIFAIKELKSMHIKALCFGITSEKIVPMPQVAPYYFVTASCVQCNYQIALIDTAGLESDFSEPLWVQSNPKYCNF